MLELHHWEANGASARVLIALIEKRLAFESRYVDVAAREQHRPGFVALNASGEVPVLVDGAAVLHGASYICEYLEEAYPDRPLMPRDPRARFVVRGWQKFVDDYFAGAVSDLAWEAFRDTIDPDALAAGAESAPTEARRTVWRDHAAPFAADRIERAEAYAAQGGERIDAALAAGGEWLAGDIFTLADIAMYGWAAYLPQVAPSVLGDRAAAWLERVGQRVSVRAALGYGRGADPFRLAAPGPEQIRWG